MRRPKRSSQTGIVNGPAAPNAGATQNEDVKNLGWNRIKKVVRRFYGSELFKGIIEELKIPAA